MKNDKNLLAKAPSLSPFPIKKRDPEVTNEIFKVCRESVHKPFVSTFLVAIAKLTSKD